MLVVYVLVNKLEVEKSMRKIEPGIVHDIQQQHNHNTVCNLDTSTQIQNSNCQIYFSLSPFLGRVDSANLSLVHLADNVPYKGFHSQWT